MYNSLIYTGRVRWRSRGAAIQGALKVLWAALNGWIISGVEPNPDAKPDAELATMPNGLTLEQVQAYNEQYKCLKAKIVTERASRQTLSMP